MNKKLIVTLKDYKSAALVRKKSFLIRVMWYITNNLLFRSYAIPINNLKRFFLRIFGAKVGRGVVIKPGVNIKYPWLLELGDHVWIGEGVWIDNLTNINIGCNVCISQGAMLLTGNHDYKKISFDLILKPITLEDGVWIGAKSIVCPGVICFTHSILTAGSIATHSIEPYSVYQGNPAVKIRERIINNPE
jgi:putative colanic acid biosynthesis acetyltransferase WcaF